MKINRNLALSDSGFIFDPSSGNSFTCNPLGLRILQLLREETTESELISVLQTEYEIDASTLKRDLADFISMCHRLKLLAS